MARLKRDERVCPFCGEHIKAVAIRCRYCQSDIAPQVGGEAEKSAKPRAEKLAKPGAEKLAKPGAEKPAKPGAEKPAKPEVEPEAEKPAKPEVEPEAEKSVEPEAEKPVEPEAEKPVEPEAEKSVEPEAEKSVEPEADNASGEPLPAGDGASGRPMRRWLTALLATLVALAAIAVGVAWRQAESESAAVAPSGTLVGYEARTRVLVEAADLTERTLSYNYKTLENDMEVARARMTPSFRKTYEETMAQVKANTKKNEIALEAVVVSSAIIEATKNKAKVLVFVNQTTTAGTGDKKNQQLTRNSLVVTLTRDDGDWAMSKLTALS